MRVPAIRASSAGVLMAGALEAGARGVQPPEWGVIRQIQTVSAGKKGNRRQRMRETFAGVPISCQTRPVRQSLAIDQSREPNLEVA
jgi:hypothetical protein